MSAGKVIVNIVGLLFLSGAVYCFYNSGDLQFIFEWGMMNWHTWGFIFTAFAIIWYARNEFDSFYGGRR